MQRFLVSVGVLAVLSCLCSPVRADQSEAKTRLAKEIDGAAGLADNVKAFAKQKLLPLCTNEVFVKEVKAQNATKAALAEIQALDKQWMDAEDELPIQKEKLNNDCAKEVKKVAGDLGVVTEMFVMDDQGANVGQNTLTSDYWQGDEPKWQKSFNGGAGGIDVSARKFDKSANAEDQKISLPIFDENGAAIGAVCIGLAVDKL